MAKGLEGLGQMRPTINVTPLVDVLLVLLIIFIMVAPILTKALQSEIPQKADQPLPAEYAKRQLVIHVCADGRLLLNREEVGLSSLPRRLREIFAQRGGQRVIFLDADQASVYGTVVKVMDLCRDGGVETIGVIPDSIGPALDGGS
ncbi:MAG: biopolymer transporter ExbD [Candidatus Eisenbacteria sp.]|nr:biopolymer transporter ExbD [Candidatus Eisenbacteria bacterium]